MDSRCNPRACTAFPLMHVCGSQALHSSLFTTATLTASSDSHSPTAVIGGAWSQSQARGDDTYTARSLTLSALPTKLLKRSEFADLLPPVRPVCYLDVMRFV